MLPRSLWLTGLGCLVCGLLASLVLAEEEEEKVEQALKMLEHLTETRKGLDSLRKIVTDIDGDLQKTQKRTCYVGGGMGGHCSAAFLSDRVNMHDYLNSGMSPGKKRSVDSATQQQLLRQFGDLSRKRKGLDILQRILNEMEADLMYEQKRTCQFNLGGHCATESAAYVADHWHYLNSPLSPGRKRRDTRMYKALMSGKLLQ